MSKQDLEQHLLQMIAISVDDEDFAIKILDLLLDKVWTKEQILTVINEILPEQEELEDSSTWENERKSDHREYERSV